MKRLADQRDTSQLLKLYALLVPALQERQEEKEYSQKLANSTKLSIKQKADLSSASARLRSKDLQSKKSDRSIKSPKVPEESEKEVEPSRDSLGSEMKALMMHDPLDYVPAEGDENDYLLQGSQAYSTRAQVQSRSRPGSRTQAAQPGSRSPEVQG